MNNEVETAGLFLKNIAAITNIRMAVNRKRGVNQGG